MNKYELIKEDTKQYFGTTLYRVRYLIDLPGIKSGDLGGYVRSKKNLLRTLGNAIVIDNAMVNDTAIVIDNARVRDYAIVIHNATVAGDAVVDDDAVVAGDAIVTDSARVSGNAVICGNARVRDNARVAGDVTVGGNSQLYGDSICEKFNPINIIGLTYNVTITDNNIHIGCKTFKLKQALKLASKWTSTKLNYEEAEEIEAEKKIIVEAIKFRLYQLEQLSKEEGGRL